MARNSEKVIAEQKAAMTETLEVIEKCKKTHSKTLEIGYNGYLKLTVIPEEIRQLTWLTGLYVVYTDIRIIPDWIGELENLKVSQKISIFLNL
jgi:Leucine-rich repeat (LRR) protein